MPFKVKSQQRYYEKNREDRLKAMKERDTAVLEEIKKNPDLYKAHLEKKREVGRTSYANTKIRKAKARVEELLKPLKPSQRKTIEDAIHKDFYTTATSRDIVAIEKMCVPLYKLNAEEESRDGANDPVNKIIASRNPPDSDEGEATTQEEREKEEDYTTYGDKDW
jgi:hypothetical protein